MKKKDKIWIYPLALMAVLLILSVGCKKKKASDTTSECVAVGNTGVSYTNGFDRPVGIAFSPAQKVVVTEYRGMDNLGNWIGYGFTAPVKLFLNTTNFYANVPDLPIPGMYAPEAVIFDASENLYITQTEVTAGISIFKPPYLALFKTIQSGFNNPRGIALDGSGNLYVADDGNGKIVKISNPLGVDSESDLITGLISPKAVAIAGTYIFIAEYDGNRVTKYNIASPAASVETYNIDHPIDLHVSGCMLYISTHGVNVGGYGSSKVVAVTTSNMNAGVQKEYTGFSGIIFGIATDQAGNLFISDFSEGKIRKYLR
jgi:NHL repeat